MAINRDRVTRRRDHSVGADFQRLNRAAHGGFGQPARAYHALAEPDDPRERVDDDKAAP